MGKAQTMMSTTNPLHERERESITNGLNNAIDKTKKISQLTHKLSKLTKLSSHL